MATSGRYVSGLASARRRRNGEGLVIGRPGRRRRRGGRSTDSQVVERHGDIGQIGFRLARPGGGKWRASSGDLGGGDVVAVVVQIRLLSVMATWGYQIGLLGWPGQAAVNPGRLLLSVPAAGGLWAAATSFRRGLGESPGC